MMSKSRIRVGAQRRRPRSISYSPAQRDSPSGAVAKRLLLVVAVGSVLGARKFAMYGGDEVSAVVMEIGSSSTKCGYAGEDTPKFVLPSAVGVMGGGEASSTDKAKKQYFVGSNAMAVRRDGMRVESPMTDGIVTDWGGGRR